jgi:hypothetical protein
MEQNSEKHKIVSRGSYDRRETILRFPGFLSWYKKTVIPKKKFIAARNLRVCLPSLPQKKKSEKENQSFFITTILCFPEKQERYQLFGMGWLGVTLEALWVNNLCMCIKSA